VRNVSIDPVTLTTKKRFSGSFVRYPKEYRFPVDSARSPALSKKTVFASHPPAKPDKASYLPEKMIFPVIFFLAA
jgi:hypothetical protein